MSVPSSGTVSVPYEITLLSNPTETLKPYQLVSVPYEITLLSNGSLKKGHYHLVSVPYEITLLSNGLTITAFIIKFQYLMKLHYSQT